jgi:predicted amidohydrolase YtcJ
MRNPNIRSGVFDGLSPSKGQSAAGSKGTEPGVGQILFTGGALFDGRAHRGPQDVLVADGRIVAVGDAVREHVDGAELVDLAGSLLSPGFTDAHIHPIHGGLERMQCDLSGLETRAEYLEAISAYATAHPDAEWILGGGWAMPAFPGGTPTAADLDSVVPDRPVFLPNRDHHGAWVNTRALEIAGIDEHTPDPPDGRIERDADGRPTGTLHEGADELVGRFVPRTSGEEYYAALMTAQAYLHSLGVTSWQDAAVGAFSGLDDPAATYAQADAAGDLRSYVVGALWWERRQGVEQVEDLAGRREAVTGNRFRATAVKIMQDGVAENGSAAMTAPYLDLCGHPTDNAGHSFIDPETLREAVAALDTAGFQVHVHAIGDRGVREALDAFVGTDPARRHHIAHVQLIHPDDVARFAQLGVAANMQALWACLEDQMVDLTLPVLGPERSTWQYPFGELHRTGASLVMGSDWPVSTPDPLAAIHTAVTRTTYGDTGRAGREPFLPEQALDLTTAFSAYTRGSAWVNHRDDAGVVEPGAVADLVVLDRDPFAGPPSEIGAARVASTWVAGECVYAP